MISARCIACIFSDWYWKAAGVNFCFFIFNPDHSQWFIHTVFENLPNNTALIQPDRFRKSLIHDHALRRLRPFALLRLMILRPPGVAILARKPCFFFRRRLFGWKVRFIGFWLKQYSFYDYKQNKSFELIIVKNSSFKDDSVRDFNPHTLFWFWC